MAGLRGQRSVVWAGPLVLVAAVVAAVLLLGGNDEAPGTDGAGAATSPAAPTTTVPTTVPTASTAEVDPDTWCQAFLAFADAQAQYVGSPDDPAAQAALQEQADALLAIGRPVGLSPGGLTSLQLLVDGALDQAGDPTAPPGSAAPDEKAFSDYLNASCPA